MWSSSGDECNKMKMAMLLVSWLCFLVLGLAPGSAVAKTSRVDIEALMQLKASIDPSTLHSSSCLGSWDFSVDPCSESTSPTFFVCGIRCDEQEELQQQQQERKPDQRVTSIVLDGYGYRGSLSPFIGNLSALQVLDVSGNALSGQLPDSIGKLSRLVRLDVTGNRFSGFIPYSVGNLASLEHLGLARNGFSGSIPDSITRLSRLRHLYLYSNFITGELPPSISSMNSLLYLDASSNRLTGPLESRLPLSLLQLSLRDNRFVGFLPGNSLRSMPGLEVLDLSRNLLSGGIDEGLLLHQSLQQVNLAYNRLSWIEVGISAAGTAQILGSRLVALDASFNMLRGTLPPFLAALPRLSSLSLRGNALRGMIPLGYAIKAVESLVGIQPLRRLYLDQNLLTGVLPPPFLNLLDIGISASFANNCLQSCPLRLPFCGLQRPAAQCTAAAP